MTASRLFELIIALLYLCGSIAYPIGLGLRHAALKRAATWTSGAALGLHTVDLIMRLTDVVFAFPSVLLAVAITGALGAGIGITLLALTIVLIPPIVRVAESATTGVRNMDFIEAARASGADSFTILRVHVLGNILGPVLVYATSLLSVSIIMAAGLSFIGLGAKPPTAEWGLMLNTLRNALYSQPLVAALPGVLIFAVSLCFNLLADGLRNAMEVQ